MWPSEAARSVTQSSSARTKAWSRRRRVSFASTLNTDASPPAWIGDRSGRSFNAGLVQQPASSVFGVLLLISLVPIFAKLGEELPQNIQNDRLATALRLNGSYFDKHLDRAADAYGDWKRAQEGDVVRNSEVLRQQLLDEVVAQEGKLKSLQEQSDEIEKNLRAVGEPGTSAAFDFHNQLIAAQLLLQIETGDATFRFKRLHEYLARNY